MSKRGVYEDTLENGLKLIAEANPSNSSTALGFFVKAGARDELESQAGISHFLEHMMFKGTEKRSALELTYALGKIGAQINAYTSEENTVYYAAVIPEYFSEIFEILSDMLRSSLDPEEFKTEKKVILEEIALYQDRPHFFLFETALKDYFVEHPAGNSVLGSTDSVSGITQPQMKAYFDDRYVPSNMTLVAAGNLDWDEFRASAAELCGAWADHKVSREIAPYPAQEMQKVYHRKNLTQSHVLLMTEGAGVQDEHRYPLGILASMIGGPTGSRFYWELVDRGLVESAGADNDEKYGTGVFMAYASTRPEQLDEVEGVLRKILATPLEYSDDDLERAKTKIVSRVVLDGELPLGRLMSLGLEWTHRSRLHNLREITERIRNVTRADIERALERYPLDRWSSFRLIPEDT